PVLDAHGLGDRDLHVIDVAPVPHRLEEPVGEAEDHDVLHGLLAEVVVDPVDLALVQDGAETAIKLTRGLEVAAEWLLDDDPAPAPPALLEQADLAEALDDLREEIGRHRQVEEHASPAVVAAVALPLPPRRPLLGGGGVGRLPPV